MLSDQIKIKITSNPGETFLDRMIAWSRAPQRQKTPNEIALNILIAGLTLIFLLAVITLQPYRGLQRVARRAPATVPTVAVLVSLLVCLIPTTIGGLLSAIGIAGMDRVMQHNVLAMSGKAVEAVGRRELAAARQDRHDHARQPPGGGVPAGQRRRGARNWPTPRSCRAWPTRRRRAARSSSWRRRSTACAAATCRTRRATFIPFSAYTRMSGVDFDGRQLRKGATDAIAAFVTERGGTVPADFPEMSDRISRSGGTPLAVADGKRLLGRRST